MKYGVSLLTAIGCAVLVMPILIVVTISFGGDTFIVFPPRHYSLHWFQVLFGDADWREAFVSSVKIALVACVLATFTGFLAAYALVRGRFPFKRLIFTFTLLPMIVPTIITSVAMYFLTAKLGLVGNVLWVGICHAVLALPLVVLILSSVLQSIDPNLERAALSLGASRARMLRTLVAPLALPGMVSAALFAFLASFDELVVAMFLTNAQSKTLPVKIWNSLELEIEPTISAVSTVLIVVTALVLVCETLLRRASSRAASRAASH
jgi:putative spermidine/putrescine transport system permease protein